MEIKEIVKELKDICRIELDQVSDNCILESAIKLHISQNINASEKENIKDMRNNLELKNIMQPRPSNKGFQPILKATDKQISFLKSLGYKGDLDLTKIQAFNLIKRLKETKNGKLVN